MNLYYTTKHRLKVARWKIRRTTTARRWGSNALQNSPAVLGNAMPKSGSHLISQVLQGLPQIGAFVNPGFPPVNRTEDNQILPDTDILRIIQRMRSGDIAYGYIRAKEPFISALSAPGRATIFAYRDPRDMIVSHIFYATQMHEGHGMHRYYTEQLHSMEERINAAIEGVSETGSEIKPVLDRYDTYMGWLDTKQVLSLRFEDLILNRDAAFRDLLDYLADRGFTPQLPRPEAIAILNQAIVPTKSGTFRKGKTGGWREHFTEANKVKFIECTGDLLVRLRYEKDNDW
ncbi:MAG: sulfotransferase domain-containing protein [Chloroflexota bacterium]|nr:sulfotransferase domain-containing protein [Chloroflexota bacterium]